MKMQVTKRSAGTLTGAALGFLAFVVVGALPSLLYGGYAGLVMAAALFGAPVETTWISQILVFGGMALGFVAVLSLFVVVGAAAGSAVALAAVSVSNVGEKDAQPERSSIA